MIVKTLKCDVCGKTYEPYNEGCDPHISPNSILLASGSMGSDTVNYSPNNYDLCIEYMTKIMNVLGRERKESNEEIEVL